MGYWSWQQLVNWFGHTSVYGVKSDWVCVYIFGDLEIQPGLSTTELHDIFGEKPNCTWEAHHSDLGWLGCRRNLHLDRTMRGKSVCSALSRYFFFCIKEHMYIYFCVHMYCLYIYIYICINIYIYVYIIIYHYKHVYHNMITSLYSNYWQIVCNSYEVMIQHMHTYAMSWYKQLQS